MSWKRRRSVQDSERANLCKIVAQGGERGEQACKGACKRLGACCVCWGEGKAGRAEGPGGGRVVEGRQVVESEGTPSLRPGARPPSIRLRAHPLWLWLSPPPQNRPFPPSPSPSVIFPAPPPLPASHTHTISCQLPPPSRCKCLARIRPPGDLRWPWETRAGRSFSRVPGPGERERRSGVRGQEASRLQGSWTGWSVQASHHLSRKNLRARSMFMRWPTLVTPRST